MTESCTFFSKHSLERIQAYINIDHEPKSTEGGTPPAYWPASGDLRVEKLCARYSTDGPKVLQDISFHIKAGERVGVGKYRELCLTSSRLTVSNNSGSYRKREEFAYPLFAPLYLYRGVGILRRGPNALTES